MRRSARHSFQQARTASPVDSPGNSAAAKQRAVGGVDDRINVLGGDVPWMALIEATCRAMVPTVVPEAYGSTAVQMFRLDSQ